MKCLHLLFFCFLATTVFTQPDFGEPELDSALLNSKQYKRVKDFSQRRATEGLSGEWLKRQAWEDVLANQTKSSMTPWENHGPDAISGRIISIDFHPSDPNTFLVGSASGGLWKTTDYGTSWECLTDAYFTMGVGAVAYNPQNPQSILIATGEGYGFGSEFTQGFGVYISHDGGDNWSPTAIVATYEQFFAGMDIVWHPSDTTIVNVSSSFGNYHSTDGGINYTYTLDRMGGRMMPDPLNPNRLYFTARYYNDTYPGGFYLSTDAGANWSLTGAGLPIPYEFGYTGMFIHPVYNQIIYLTVSQSAAIGSGPLEGLYKSSNYGATFTEIPTTQDMMCYPAPYEYICQGWYDNTILMDLTDTLTLYSGGTRLWKSLDGGINWNLIDTMDAAYAVHADHHQTLWHPLTGDLFDCNDGGVNFTSDGGSTWTNISDGLITHQFYSIASAETDPEVVIGGTQDVGTFSSTTAHSGGWVNNFSGDSFGHDISNLNSNVWYGTSFINFQRLKSVDFGSTWLQINTGTSGADQWRMTMVVHPLYDNILMSANDNFIYKSTNGGTSWTAVAAIGQIGTFEWDNVNPDIVYAHDLYGGRIYKSLDGGDSWFLLVTSTVGNVTDLATDPNNSGTVYITIGGYGPSAQVYISEDGGLTWMDISTDLPEVPANTIDVSPYNPEEVYVGNEFGVWMSLDGGSSWQAFNDGLPAAVVVEDLHFYAPDTTIRIGTYGRGYWRTDAMSKTYASLSTIHQPALRIYPNPSEQTFRLSQDIGRYEIYNQQGVLILTGTSKTIDLSGQSTGMYYLRSAGASRKLVKL